MLEQQWVVRFRLSEYIFAGRAALSPGGSTCNRALNMKAVYITKYGGCDELVYGSLPRPEPRSGQVLVRVRAAAVNPRDCILREGRYVFRFALPRFPLILGSDLSGEVVKCGPDASRF